MKPVSLADISYEQGLKLLFLRKQALDEGMVQQLPPAALANSFIMNSTGTQVIKQAAGIKDFIPTDPAVRSLIGYGLGGVGLGALGAGGLAAARNEKNWKKRMLQGATAGGLLGGGLGLALNPGVITDSISPAVSDMAEKGMQTGKPTPEAQRQDYVDELKSRSNANPWFGAAIPTVTGAAASFGLNKGLKSVPGMQGLDRPALADWMVRNPRSVDWNKFFTNADDRSALAKWLASNPDKPNWADIVETKAPTPAPIKGSDSLDDLVFDAANRQIKNRMIVYDPMIHEKSTPQAAGSPPQANKLLPHELQKDVADRLKKRIPLNLPTTAKGLSGYTLGEGAAEQAAEHATNSGIFSNAPKTLGKPFRSLLKGNLTRRGVTGIPAIIGSIMGANQVYRDMQAVEQAKQQLKNIERGITPEMLYGVPREGYPLPRPIVKDPSNINNASLIARLLQKGLGLSLPTRGDYRGNTFGSSFTPYTP